MAQWRMCLPHDCKYLTKDPKSPRGAKHSSMLLLPRCSYSKMAAKDIWLPCFWSASLASTVTNIKDPVLNKREARANMWGDLRPTSAATQWRAYTYSYIHEHMHIHMGFFFLIQAMLCLLLVCAIILRADSKKERQSVVENQTSSLVTQKHCFSRSCHFQQGDDNVTCTCKFEGQCHLYLNW